MRRKFSRMRSRRVPVLRLGSRGPGGDARSLRLCSQASAIVPNRPQSSAIVRNRSQAFAERRTCVGLASDLPETKIVAKRRTVVAFYVSYHRHRGGFAELSSLLDSSWVFASQKCQQTQGSQGSWSRSAELSYTVITFELVSGLRISKVSTDTGIAGVVVAKRRTVVYCHHFWTRLGSSRLKSVNSHRDRRGRGRETQNCRILSSLLDSSRVFASQKCQQTQGSQGSWSRNAELSYTVVTFGLASGGRRGERREEKREMRGERGKEKEERRER